MTAGRPPRTSNSTSTRYPSMPNTPTERILPSIGPPLADRMEIVDAAGCYRAAAPACNGKAANRSVGRGAPRPLLLPGLLLELAVLAEGLLEAAAGEPGLGPRIALQVRIPEGERGDADEALELGILLAALPSGASGPRRSCGRLRRTSPGTGRGPWNGQTAGGGRRPWCRRWGCRPWCRSCGRPECESTRTPCRGSCGPSAPGCSWRWRP